MSQQEDHRVVFGISEDKSTVILGVPTAAWEFMKEGMTHTLDLTSLGVPVRIIMYGGKDRAAVLKPLQQSGKLGKPLDLTGLDFGFGPQGGE